MADPIEDASTPMPPPRPSERPRSVPPSAGNSLRFAVAVVVVAAGAAVFATLFRASLTGIYRLLFGARDVLDAFRALPPALRVIVPAIGGLLTGVVVRISAKSGEGGVSSVMEAVVRGRTRLSLRRTGWQALGSWLAIASGGSVGREGPLIQFGGSFGSAIARAMGLSNRDARSLIAAGTAAGFTAAYNTPLAAVLFVLEIVTGIVVLDAILPSMIAVAIATTLTRAIVGPGPIYGERAFTIASPGELAAHAGLGLLCAFGAQAFMRTLSLGERLFAESRIPQPFRAMVGGLVVGVFALWVPEVTGNGYEPLNILLDGRYGVAMLALLFVSKGLATTASVSSGSPGGVFTPSLLLGGALGMLYGHLVVRLGGAQSSEGSFALVGMAAAAAATTQGPMMAAVLVFELSSDYAIVLPLVLATAIATAASRALRRESIYTAELRRRGIQGWDLTFEGRKFRP